MILKTTCLCGSEFYISTNKETTEMLLIVSDKWKDFLKIHRPCYKDVLPDELPNDWKL